MTERLAGSQLRGIGGQPVCRRRQRRCFHESFSRVMVRQQRFDLGAQCVIAAAGPLEERAPLLGRTLQRPVIQPRNLPPSVGVHAVL